MNKHFLKLCLFTGVLMLSYSISKNEVVKAHYIIVYEFPFCKDCVTELFAELRQNKATFYQGFVTTENPIVDSLQYYNIKSLWPTVPIHILDKANRKRLKNVKKWPIIYEISSNKRNVNDTTILLYNKLFNKEGNLIWDKFQKKKP